MPEQARPAITLGHGNLGRHQGETDESWWQTRFGATCLSAEWSDPKNFRRNTPTAELGREGGQSDAQVAVPTRSGHVD